MIGTGTRYALASVVAAAFMLAPATWAPAADAAAGASLSISGRVQHPQSLSLADLQKLPPTNVQVSFVTGHGTEAGTFTGVLLWTLLGGAGLIDEAGKNARLRHTIVVTGRDGYAVALSLGEIDPDFEGKPAILAYAKDGIPLDASDGIRLIVPNDKHGGRAVKDVAGIEVR